jgi:hypothetical protein
MVICGAILRYAETLAISRRDERRRAVKLKLL